MNIFDLIRKSFSEGKIKEGIESLLEYTSKIEDPDLRNYAISTSARLRLNYRKENLGIGSNDEDLNKVIISSLELVDELEELFNKHSGILPTPLVKDNKRKVFDAYYDLISFNDKFNDLGPSEKHDLYLSSIELKQRLYEGVDKRLKESYPKIVFSRLYYNKELYEVEYEQMNQIVDDEEVKWYDKSIIVSGLTLALLRDFDNKKLETLIKFTVGFEDKVWQRALVGIVLALQENSNLLLLYPRTLNKLKQLKEHRIISEALTQIYNDLFSKSYKTHFGSINQSFKASNFDYFQNPLHWLVPFHRSHPILDMEIRKFPNIDKIHLLPELLVQDRHIPITKWFGLNE